MQFASEEPEYYYTKLDELKLQLIEEATQNAKDRIDLMAQGTGSTVGELSSANLGVFQITAQNSNTEYSYGGYFDTSSRNKTASITVRQLTKESQADILGNLLKRSPNNYTEYEDTVNGIIREVREKGDQAVFAFTKRFDKWDAGAENVRVTKEEMEQA